MAIRRGTRANDRPDETLARPFLGLHPIRLMASAMLVLGLALPAQGADEKREKDWSLEITPYLWAAGINGDTGIGDERVPVNVSFINILTHFRGAAFADITIRYKRFGIISDIGWLKIGGSKDISDPFAEDALLDLNTIFGTAALSYRFEPKPGLFIDPYVGARYWRVEPTFDFRGGALGDLRLNPVESWADVVFGARLHYDITDKWYVRTYGDVGGGVSTAQWQVFGGGGYSFTEWLGLNLGYRAMGVSYSPDDFAFNIITQASWSGWSSGSEARHSGVTYADVIPPSTTNVDPFT